MAIRFLSLQTTSGSGHRRARVVVAIATPVDKRATEAIPSAFRVPVYRDARAESAFAASRATEFASSRTTTRKRIFTFPAIDGRTNAASIGAWTTVR